MVLKKLDASLGWGAVTANANTNRGKFALIAKPISEGTPVGTDFTNEKYVKWMRECYSFKDDANNQYQADYIHLGEVLKVVIDIGWNIFFAVLNNSGVTAFFNYWLRLFVKYI